MDRISVINKSVAAFVCGLLSLLPLIGLPFGIAAVAQFIRVRSRRNVEWNPAERYLDLGATFALIGFGLTLLAIGIALFGAINHSVNLRGRI